MPRDLCVSLTALLLLLLPSLLTALPQDDRCRACSPVSARFCCRFFGLCCAEVPQCRPNSLPSDKTNVTSGGRIPCPVSARLSQKMRAAAVIEK